MVKRRRRKPGQQLVDLLEEEAAPDAETAKQAVAIVNVPKVVVDGQEIDKLAKLSTEEKSICAKIIERGNMDFLRFELSWSAVQIRAFISKKSVRAELDYLKRAYAQREGIQERTQFFAQLRINQMVPAALKVVAQALQGDKVSDDGAVARAPSRGQFDAALDILDRANIHGAKYKGDDNVPTIDARSVSVSLGESGGENDPVDMSSRSSREAVRTFMQKLIDRMDTDGKSRKSRKKKARKESSDEED